MALRGTMRTQGTDIKTGTTGTMSTLAREALARLLLARLTATASSTSWLGYLSLVISFVLLIVLGA